MAIGSKDIVLEIGGGHNPDPRSDILCDKYLEDNTQRGGGLRRDRDQQLSAMPNLFLSETKAWIIQSHGMF